MIYFNFHIADLECETKLSVSLTFGSNLFLAIGEWSSWDNWNACTKSCGAGRKTRKRECMHFASSLVRKNCTGEAIETTKCNTNECPGRSITYS